MVALIALGTVPTTLVLTVRAQTQPTIQSQDNPTQPIGRISVDSDKLEQPRPAMRTLNPNLVFTDLEESMTGTWLLYMTPQGDVERGPDPIAVHSAGPQVFFLIWQKDYAIPVSGGIQGGDLQLSGDSIYYGDPVSFSASARVTADTMTGTYNYSGAYVETGTFRAVKNDAKKTKGWVRVAHVGGEYALDFYVWDLIPDRVFITSVTVSGPHIDSLTLPTGDGEQTSISLGNQKPLAGDTYTFTIGYNDGTSETTRASVRNTVVDSPLSLSPGEGDVAAIATPTFSWAHPPNGRQGYYRIWVTELHGHTVWSTYLPRDTTSVVYNNDSTGIPLQPGNTYEWRLIAFDQPTRGGPDNNVWVTTQFSVR